MSWHFLQGQEEVCSQAISWDGERCAPSSETRIAEKHCWRGRETESCLSSHSGMMLGHSTRRRGGVESTSYRAASRASDSAQQLEVKRLRKTSGRRCSEWWRDVNQISFIPKMFLDQRLKLQRKTCVNWVTLPLQSKFRRETWAQTIFGQDIGYLHTPTCTANYSSPSMQKWKGCRAFVQVFGRPSPTNHEWLMGWPIGWTGLAPLETGRFLSWRQQHSGT
jgi:hypothetical protein